MSSRLKAAAASRTLSTFSCDIDRAVSRELLSTAGAIIGAMVEDSVEWLNGTALAAWLEARPEWRPELLSAGAARAFGRWRAGGAASIWTADEVLTRLEIPLLDVPNEVGLPCPAAGARRAPLPRHVDTKWSREFFATHSHDGAQNSSPAGRFACKYAERRR